MQIAINDMSQKSLVCVVVDDFCNHYDSQYEDHEVDVYSFWSDAARYVPDMVGHKELLTCQRCGAWQDEDGFWECN